MTDEQFESVKADLKAIDDNNKIRHAELKDRIGTNATVFFIMLLVIIISTCN